MRQLLTLCIFFQSIVILGQKIDTTCNPRKLLPFMGDYYPEQGVFEISEDYFNLMVDKISRKMRRGRVLTNDQAIFLIKYMNTIRVCSLEYESALCDINKNVKVLEGLFKKVYAKALRCQYSAFLASGGGIFYEELNIVYTGKSTICPKLFVEVMGFENEKNDWW